MRWDAFITCIYTWWLQHYNSKKNTKLPNSSSLSSFSYSVLFFFLSWLSLWNTEVNCLPVSTSAWCAIHSHKLFKLADAWHLLLLSFSLSLSLSCSQSVYFTLGRPYHLYLWHSHESLSCPSSSHLQTIYWFTCMQQFVYMRVQLEIQFFFLPLVHTL